MTTVHIKTCKGDDFIPWPEVMKSWPTENWLAQQSISHRRMIYFSDGMYATAFYAIRVETLIDIYEWNCKEGFVAKPGGSTTLNL